MQIQQVRATAFGPLSKQVLDFAPGMTVAHGPNEAGKSAWFAATYAALAGRRRARGRGTASQREFSQRHKPWTGSRWAVGGTFALADGTVLVLEHNLRTGETSVAESTTGRSMTVARLEQQLGVSLETEGGFDGARLLGLTRDSLRAVAFVAQADVLRVVEDASELQHLLERASSSVDVDVTADGALEALRQIRSERIGAEHVGSRPLRMARQRVEAARTAMDTARDRQNEWVTVLEQGQRAAADLAEAEAALAKAERSLVWTELRAERERLQTARALTAQLADLGSADAVDEDRIAEVRAALARYEARGEAPTELVGDSAEQLRAMLAALSPMPEGDREPRSSVIEARQAAVAAATAAATHADGAPSAPADLELEADPEQLRSLAGILDEQAPEAHPALMDELQRLRAEFADATVRHEVEFATYQQARTAAEAARTAYESEMADYRIAVAAFERQQASREDLASQARTQPGSSRRAGRQRSPLALLLAILGVILLVAGIAAGVLATWVTGGALVGAGAVAVGAGVALGRQSPAPAVAPSATPVDPPLMAPLPPALPNLTIPEPPPSPVAPPRIAELETLIRVAEDQATAFRTRREEAVGVAATLGLPADGAQLRELARRVEDATGAATRVADHQRRETALHQQWREAVTCWLQSLVHAGQPEPLTVPMDDIRALHDAAETAHREYVEVCRERAERAAHAARRDDLESRLQARLEAEAKAGEELRLIANREAAIIDLHTSLDAAESRQTDHATAAVGIRAWLAQAASDRKTAEHGRELRGRLEQALDGRDLEEWDQDLGRREAAAGADPGTVATEAEVASRREALARLNTTVGALQGQAQQIAETFDGLAERVEAESAAERDLARVESLQRCLELAVGELQRAKETSQRSVAAPLAQLMRPLLPRVTDGRYVDVEIDPATLGMTARDARGGRSDAQLLSHGTTEQLYVLLRLALTEFLVRRDEPAPFVLDDVTVQSDAVRTTGVLELLHEVSERRQVILFTQEDEVVTWARQHLTGPRDRLVSIERRA